MAIAQVIMVVLAIITIGVGVAVKSDMPKPNPVNEQVAGSATQVPEPLNTSLPLPTVTPTATVVPLLTPSPLPLPSASDSLIYPNSTIVSVASFVTKLTSADDPNKIADWYQNQLKNIGYSATSIAKTNTNGNFLAKLASGEEGHKIQISIDKKSNDSVTSVEVQVTQ